MNDTKPTNTAFQPELVISQAINLSKDFIPIDEIKMAEIANFTPKEISMLKLFWNPCFNSSWMYLSDDMILNFLTKNKISKAGDFIWTYKKTTFTKDELKEINRKNCMKISKIDEDGNEVERYNSIKEAGEKNNHGRGVIDRMIENKQFRNGFGFKIFNKANKVSSLTSKEKKDLLKDYDNGMTIDDISKKYSRVKRYIKTLVKNLDCFFCLPKNFQLNLENIFKVTLQIWRVKFEVLNVKNI